MLKVPKELLVLQDLVVREVHKVLKVLKVQLDILVHKGTEDHKVLRGHKELQVRQDQEELEDLRVLKGLKEVQVRQVLKVLEDPKEPKVLLDSKGLKVVLDHQEEPDQEEHRVRLVLIIPLPVLRELKEHRVVHKELRVPQVQIRLVLKVHKVHKDL